MLIKCNLIIIIIYLKNFTTEVRYYIIFAAAAVGVATGRERGGELEVHINLMPPGVTKISFFSIFWTFRAASSWRHQSLPNSVCC
jgi:hypothetical protein